MSPLGWLLRILIRVYQLFVSPLMAPSCRYYPTCSGYALEALGRHGALLGMWLSLRRLLRCHPWGGQGFDPVPEEAPRPGLAWCRGAGTGARPASKPLQT
jgi:putative membrane protein insertion efficiency factor